MAGGSVKPALGAVFLLTVLAFAGWSGWTKRAIGDVNKVEKQVAEDAVKQYAMMSHHGAARDRCVQAGTVVAAYLRAKDDAHYEAWKKTETADCVLAGLPR